MFLTANEEDVTRSINAVHPAGLVLPSEVEDDERDVELRVAFDFDCVIVDDEAEKVYQRDGLDAFVAHETNKADVAHAPGLLADLFRKLAFMRKLEDREIAKNLQYKRIVRVAIVTARGAPAHERMVTTLKAWGVDVDETFLLGGMKKFFESCFLYALQCFTKPFENAIQRYHRDS